MGIIALRVIDVISQKLYIKRYFDLKWRPTLIIYVKETQLRKIA